ncbi:hypothetical protein KFE19_12975 [Dysosmobacter sp. Marseille-Q4140]|nr:hypothetical protein KFE19_12975 [Dysosmobacter sp. Marseille-Q4140]
MSTQPELGGKEPMGKRTTKPELSSVMYSYVGNDTQFDAFLKMLIHDYLVVDNPFTKPQAQIVGFVESNQN